MRQSWGRDFLCYELITSEVQARKSSSALAAVCSESLEPHPGRESLPRRGLELASGVPCCSWGWAVFHLSIRALLLSGDQKLCVTSSTQSPSNKGAAALRFCAYLVLGYLVTLPEGCLECWRGRFWFHFEWKSTLTGYGWWVLAGHGAVRKASVWGQLVDKQK